MKKVEEFYCSSYYMFESLAVARNCYFESEEEILVFKSLFRRYLDEYVHIHQINISAEGYQVLLRVRSRDYIRKLYKERLEKRGKLIRLDFWQQPWKIISEQIRIFHSLYVRAVNRLRDRKGGMVQHRYTRYMFDSFEEFEVYEKEMKAEKEIRSQRNEQYGVSERWKVGVDWARERVCGVFESLVSREFQDLVVLKLIRQTIYTHLHKNHPPP